MIPDEISKRKVSVGLAVAVVTILLAMLTEYFLLKDQIEDNHDDIEHVHEDLEKLTDRYNEDH